MISAHYSYRPNMFSRERNFWLEPSGLGWSSGDEQDRIAYRDVEQVQLYRMFMPGEARLQKKIIWRMQLQGRGGDRIVLSPIHYSGFRSWEDRSHAYKAFSDRLLAEVHRANPELKIAAQQHWTLRLRRATKRQLSALGGRLLLTVFRFIRNRDPDRTANAAGRAMRTIGPLLRGHRVARENLRHAFPEKSAPEIDRILQGMWDNLGRVIVEYAFLDRLWDFDPHEAACIAPLSPVSWPAQAGHPVIPSARVASGAAPITGSSACADDDMNEPVARAKRIIIDQSSLDRARQIRERGKPVIYVSAHVGNWEMPPVAGAALRQNLAVVYRPPDFAPVAKEILEIRTKLMDTLIPAGPRAAMTVRQVLHRGMSLGMLIDQHFARGTDAIFFGRRCKVNPTVARFARQLDCAIHGARAIRLPGGRFQIELTDALALPRDGTGKIEIAGTMQMLTSVIEGWIREHPEQWLWTHRRWR